MVFIFYVLMVFDDWVLGFSLLIEYYNIFYSFIYMYIQVYFILYLTIKYSLIIKYLIKR